MKIINCATCGKEIINPFVKQKTCGRKCSRTYQKEYQKTDKWKAYQKSDKYKAYQKEYYQRKKQEMKNE